MVPVKASSADYPRTFADFLARFDSEDACREGRERQAVQGQLSAYPIRGEVHEVPVG